MNNLKIYQLLARKPDSRAQDVADVMDVELRVASDELSCLVDVGDVLRRSGTGPNGQPAQLYSLTEVFKSTPAGVMLLAAMEQDTVSATPAKATEVEEEPEPQLSRIDRAIAYLTKNGSGGDIEMRSVLGIKKEEYPSSVLASAVKTGRIVRDGILWRLGDGVPLAAAKSARKYNTAAPSKKREPRAQFSKTAQPGDAEGQVRDDAPASNPKSVDLEPAAPPPTNKNQATLHEQPVPAQPTFRCGLWSDGVLELQRDGRSLIELQRGEHEHLADFMKRMLGAGAEAVQSA